eukprot:TRINITY_DN14027_c0_g1_i1.p1 TRINITY_DN14027_c0_g1~~TRINITY_DN14027_c0_g1_i1.p1  ORF type:complete len:302 (-),score=53.74 TRINITY_DN14027_c0_g1_i1:229-1089(-)
MAPTALGAADRRAECHAVLRGGEVVGVISQPLPLSESSRHEDSGARVSLSDVAVDVNEREVRVAYRGQTLPVLLPFRVCIESSSSSARLRRRDACLEVTLPLAPPPELSRADERRWRARQVCPFVESQNVTVDAAVELAAVPNGGVFVDLGCGDGRACIVAAQRGALALGYDCDAGCLADASRAAQAAGLQERCVFVLGDFLEPGRRLCPDNTSAIFLHLYPEVIEQLRPRLLELLEASVRIVTHVYHLRGVRAARTAKAGTLCLFDFQSRREFFEEAPEVRLRFD